MADLNYEAAKREADGKPVTFRLGGEKFTCRDVLDGMSLMAFCRSAVDQIDQGDDEGDLIESLRTMRAYDEFFEAALIAKDYRKLKRISLKSGIEARDLMPIVHDLLGLMTARPTEPPSSSEDSPSRNGTSSTDGSVSLEPVPSNN